MAVPDIGSIDYVKYTNVTRCFQIILKAAETPAPGSPRSAGSAKSPSLAA